MEQVDLTLDEVFADWLAALNLAASEISGSYSRDKIDNHHKVARAAVAHGAEVPDVDEDTIFYLDYIED